MNSIFNDKAKIKVFAQIQDSLTNLKSNSENEAIDLIINQIPKSYLDQKDDLMVICSIFGYYGRNNIKNKIGNAIKLFKKIMDPIKKHLQDESSFMWNISGSIYYIKRWMYEEGLISIDYIIQRSLFDDKFTIGEYFLPDIIEKRPEIFEKEFKSKLDMKFTEEYINEFKELRKKHFKWLIESNDFNDPFYREIEKNPLRLAIKTDDIDSFQSILSNSNIPINSNIQESILENVYLNPHEVSLIDFAIDFNSIKIIKYLFMNGAQSKTQSVFNVICSRNYEIIHMIESMNEKNFEEFCLIDSIQCWNFEMAQYSIENYNYEFLENENIEQSKYELATKILYHICYSVNFHFFDSIFLPFLSKNQIFIQEKIYEIIEQTIEDISCFFLKEFLKYPTKIDINHRLINTEEDTDESFLSIAVKNRNYEAIKILLNDPNINIEDQGTKNLLPFYIALINNSDLKILDLFTNHPKFNINAVDSVYDITPFSVSMIKRNFYAIDYIMKKFPDYKESNVSYFLLMLINNNHLMCAKVLFKYKLKNKKYENGEQFIKKLIDKFGSMAGPNVDQLYKIYHEIKCS